MIIHDIVQSDIALWYNAHKLISNVPCGNYLSLICGVFLISFMYYRKIRSLVSFVQGKEDNLVKLLNKRFDHAKFSLQPKYSPTAMAPTINDDLPNKIISGAIKIKSNVKKFTRTGVEFDDGTVEDDIDAVVLATGYKFGFPFLDKSVIDVRDNKVELYKFMFPPDLEKNTLACIGFIQPLGSTMPISEQQSRLFARVIKAREFLSLLQ